MVRSVASTPSTPAAFASVSKAFEHRTLQDRVEIGKDDEAGLRARGAQFACERENIGERGAIGDGAMAGALDDGAIGERIAEGNTEFEDVGAGIDGGERDGARGGEVGVADGEVDDEAGAVGEADRHV